MEMVLGAPTESKMVGPSSHIIAVPPFPYNVNVFEMKFNMD
jgi:hypothetical protein